jgi:hypothetical protein
MRACLISFTRTVKLLLICIWQSLLNMNIRSYSRRNLDFKLNEIVNLHSEHKYCYVLTDLINIWVKKWTQICNHHTIQEHLYLSYYNV